MHSRPDLIKKVMHTKNTDIGPAPIKVVGWKYREKYHIVLKRFDTVLKPTVLDAVDKTYDHATIWITSDNINYSMYLTCDQKK